MMIDIGGLEREVAAGAPRAIEDELDWEHLPHTHSSTFSGVELRRADDRGWDAMVTLRDGPRLRMVVTLDDDRLGFVNATYDLEGPENGRTVCRVVPLGPDRCRMELRFLAPDGPQADHAGAFAFYHALWNRLIDEDEPKMIFRTRALREGARLRAQRRTVTLADGAACAIPLVCPHLGLPLDADPDADGVVTCRWHGYRFDARTGRCVSGQSCGWRGG